MYEKKSSFLHFWKPYGFENGRFLMVSSRSPPSIITDEQLRATRKILSCVLISQLANDSDKKCDFFQFFKILIFEPQDLKFFQECRVVEFVQLNNISAGINIVPRFPSEKLIKKLSKKIIIFTLLKTLWFRKWKVSHCFKSISSQYYHR